MVGFHFLCGFFLLTIAGHLLAVASADGTIRIIDSYSGKTVHHYPVCPIQGDVSSKGHDKEPAKITCLGWGVNFTDTKSAQRHLDDAAGQLTVEDLLSPNIHPSKAASLLKADLPRELASLDIESSLPKLSTLPGTGGE
jgi:anaphase-promoting complex subunit 4